MPISMTAFLLPSNAAIPFLVEDIYVKGGFRCVAAFTDLTKIHPFAKKSGMLAYVSQDDKMYKLLADRTTWVEFKVGLSEEDVNSSFDKFDIEDYLGADLPVMLTPVDKRKIISLHSSQKLPPAPGAGYTLMSGANETLMWVDTSGMGGIGKRAAAEYEVPAHLQPSEVHDFSIAATATALLIDVILNTQDVELLMFSTPAYDDENPYRFVSGVDVLSDQGVTVQDGRKVFHRRYALIANRAGQKTFYCRFTNVGSAQSKPKVTINYLVLE